MRKVHIALCVLITAAFVALGVFVFYQSYLRLVETLRDLAFSIGIYFGDIFGIGHNIPATVTSPSAVFGWADYVPENFGEMKEDATNYFALLFDDFACFDEGEYIGVVGKETIERLRKAN